MSVIRAQSIKGYEMLELIGEGAFGAVYRAHQPVVDREVAVKIILPEYASRPDFIRRFESEAQLVAQLEHLHIVPLYDYWRDPEGAFLVMRLMKGGSLEEIIQKGPLPLAQVSRMLEQVASALAAAHRREIVHRDLKPLNILLDEDGNAYLSDFGIAKALGERSDLTVTGAIMGTPAFIAPEQIQSLSVSPQTDIYSLGVVLYAMLTGEHPFPEASPGDLIARHLRDPLPDVHDIDPSLPSGIDEVIQRATAKDPAERYPDVADMLADFREAVGPELAPPPARPLIEELLEVTNPFKGLRAFQEADADDFFGREALTRRLLARLPETGEYSRFLAVVGPSGSGKSSVVKAGLLPDLRQGALNGSEEWYITEMMPGTHPLEELELALLRIAVNQPPSLLAQLKEDGRGLLRATRRILPDGAELLLVVDQFEEVFTQSVDKSEARHFMNLIYQAVGEPDSPVRVLITLRADFYDRPLMEPDFSVLVQERTEVVVPLTSEELEEAIRCPVERVGADLEEGLALTIVGDVIEQPGALPLLQYALTELFERRSGRTLTHEAYRTIGGVLGALGRRAEEDYQHQNDSGQAISRQVFLRLVSLGEGVEDTRRRVLRSELTTIDIPTATPNPGESGISVDQVIESFGVARLLSFDHDPVTRGPTIEVAHEALLQEWRRLREWLDESRADIRLQRVLENATNDWIEAGQDASFLLRGTRLDQFEAWAVSTDLSLNRGEEEYLEISLAERREREAVEAERLARETATERRSRRFLRGLVVVMGLALIMAVILTSYAIYANNQTKAQQVIAEEQADLAFSRELTEAAFGVLETDPELSALLALQALSEADTPAAQSALHQAVPALHLVDTLVGHQDLIQGIAVSQDGQLLATASQDGTVKVWDLDAGTLLETLEFSGTSDQLEGRPPVAVAFSPDGRLLATGGFDQEVKIWELNRSVDEDTLEVNLISNLIGHTGVINAIEFSPDGSLLASAGGDKSVIIWDVDSSEQVHVLIGHMPFLNYPGGDPEASRRVKPPYSLSKPGITRSMKIENLSGVTDVAFTPGGGKLISTNAAGIVSVWDPVSGEKIGQYGPFIRNFNDKVIPEPITLYGEKDFEIILERNYLRTGHYGTIFDVDMSPRGDYFATASVDGLVKIWEISNQKTPMLVINQFAFSIAFSKDGSHLAIGARDGSIHIHDMEYGREPVLLSGHSGTIYDLAFASTGELISGGVDKFIKVWNPNPAEELFTIANTHPILSVTVNPSGDLIAIGLENKSAVVLSRETGQPLYSPLVSQEIPVNAVAFSPDGRVLVTSNMDVWDARSGKVLCNLLGHSDNITDLAFSKTSSYLASSSYDNTIKIWNIKDCDVVTTPIAELVGHENWVEGIVFSPDGETIASIGWDKTVRTWDWKSEKMIGNWGSPEMPTSIGISPDGGRLAVGDQEGNLTIWDITSDTPQASFTVPGHSGFVFDLDFSSDGNLVATASSDGEVKVWDAIEGEELLSLFGHHGVATGVEFGPDGTWLISSGTDGVIRGYTLDIDLLKDLAREKLTRSLTEEECQKYLHLDTCP